MTAPTITYGPGLIEECDSTSGWSQYKTVSLQAGGYVDCVPTDLGEPVRDDGVIVGTLVSYDNTNRVWVYGATTTNVVAGSGMSIPTGKGQGLSIGTFDTALAVVNGDVLTLTGTCSNTTDEHMYFVKDVTDISSTTYNNYRIRWKTSAASSGLQAGFTVTYSDASYDVYTLGYSTTWKVSTGTVDSGKTIASIQLWANDNPDTVNSGTHIVYFDFLQFYTGTFTFPYIRKGGVRISGHNEYSDSLALERVGDISMYMGAESLVIEITGDINTNVNWAPFAGYTTSPDTVPGDIFIALHHKAYTEAWQWLDYGRFEGKVTFRDFWIEDTSEENVLSHYHLVFKEYRHGNASYEDWHERMQYV